MREVPVPAVPAATASLLRRCALLCGALALVTSCSWGAGGDGDEGGAPPGAPTGVTAEAGSATTVHVMWNAVDGVDAYEVYRGGTLVRKVPASDRMVDVTRLRPSTAYAFTVRARAEGRLGPRSQEVRATTPAAVADDSAPTRPGGVRGRVVGSRAVQLTWSAATDDRGVVSYDVHQGDTKVHSVGGGQTAAVVTGLRPGTRYSFTVRARDAADNVSAAGEAVRLTTPGADDGRATAPTELRAVSRHADGGYHIDLTWVPPRTDGVVTEYQIHLDGRPATSLVFGGDAPRDRAEYSFYAGREAGVTHRVRVRARLSDGTWGGLSAERKVTTGESG
ncbi:putative sugar hydrolase [Streptomyces ambofaciens ATCC 23877]|uniref:Putative sugar hydrolase n=1 Tax=Streptomyces ambofaciens (strain ATCC 23877 / 3486 / DSM 40053 / JCM 4204 / NBRC 12836 / NRRL B-2516) TaxID=278992 RepID=A3KJN3_STRA7|nr:putative sugar hydrolase [Streptomyces ambofaciens ATCC 23877]CAJ89918.1 putative sugar hydrolase [Streptomyces ambofaciens ATCC 23877]